MQAQAQQTMMNRLMGIITFKAPVYKEVAEDKTANTTALLIVVVVSIVAGLLTGLIGGRGVVYGLLVTVVGALIGWLVGSFVLAFVAKQFFKGDTDWNEMLRVTGFTYVFNIISWIPVIGVIGGILQIVGNVIGIREAAGFDTTKAILTAIIAGVIVFVITLIVGGIFFTILFGASVLTSPQ